MNFLELLRQSRKSTLNICFSMSIFKSVKESKVGDYSQRWPKGSLLSSFMFPTFSDFSNAIDLPYHATTMYNGGFNQDNIYHISHVLSHKPRCFWKKSPVCLLVCVYSISSHLNDQSIFGKNNTLDDYSFCFWTLFHFT